MHESCVKNVGVVCSCNDGTHFYVVALITHVRVTTTRGVTISIAVSGAFEIFYRLEQMVVRVKGVGALHVKIFIKLRVSLSEVCMCNVNIWLRFTVMRKHARVNSELGRWYRKIVNTWPLRKRYEYPGNWVYWKFIRRKVLLLITFFVFIGDPVLPITFPVKIHRVAGTVTLR